MRLLFCSAVAMAALSCASVSAETKVDMLDYLVQKDDVKQEWTLAGVDVRPAKDPDGTDTQTFVLNKYSSADFYEIFKVTANQIQIRYEVFRPGGASGKGNWIRRFEEIGGEGRAPGQVWCNRFMVAEKGMIVRYHQDRLVFDEQAKSYVLDKPACVDDFPIWIWVTWATNDCDGLANLSFKPTRVLRLVSEWQREGKVIEWYDYSKGKGMVGWRWLERVSSLRPRDGDTTGKVFHCENGYVFVASKGDGATEPEVYAWDPTTGKQGAKLETVKLTSYWCKEQGPQWFVICRDSLREWGLVKKNERVGHNFTLPEWTAKPGATLKDLPYLYTHAPK